MNVKCMERHLRRSMGVNAIRMRGIGLSKLRTNFSHMWQIAHSCNLCHPIEHRAGGAPLASLVVTNAISKVFAGIICGLDTNKVDDLDCSEEGRKITVGSQPCHI
jgi:hypothetical protein